MVTVVAALSGVSVVGLSIFLCGEVGGSDGGEGLFLGQLVAKCPFSLQL